MRTWTRFGIGLAAIALAVAIGTGAYAMRGNDEEPASVVASDALADEARDQDGPGGAGTMAMCAPGHPDCQDMIVSGEGATDTQLARCEEAADGCVDTPCLTGSEPCAPEYAAGECVTLESDPPIVKCDPPLCVDVITIDPALPPETDVAPDGEGGSVPGAPPQTGIDPAPPVETCVPPVDCLAVADACLPPECAVSSDGTISCPEPVPCDPAPLPAEPTIEEDIVSTLPACIEPCVLPLPPDGIEGEAPSAGACPPPIACDLPAPPEGLPDDTVTTLPCVIEPCPEPDPESLVHPCAPIGPCPAPEPLDGDPAVGAPDCPPPCDETLAPDTVCVLPDQGGGSSGASGPGSAEPGTVAGAP